MPEQLDRWDRLTSALREGAVIVVSILLALGAQAWWEGRQESALEGEALETLRAELAMIDTLLLWADDHSAEVAAGASYLLRSVESPVTVSSDSLNLALIQVVRAGNTDSWLASYELLVSSGNLDVVRERELAQRIVELNQLMRVKQEADAREQAFVEGQLHPVIDLYADLNVDPHPDWYEGWGVEPPPESRRIGDIRSVLSHPGFTNLIHRRVDFRGTADFFVRRMRFTIDRIRTLSELEP